MNLTDKQNAARDLLKFSIAWLISAVVGLSLSAMILPAFGFSSMGAYQEALPGILNGTHPELVMTLRILVMISQLFMFSVPAFAFAWFFKRGRSMEFLRLHRFPKATNLLLAIGIVLAAFPAAQSMMVYIQSQVATTAENNEMQNAILAMPRPIDFAMNLLLMGVVAGLGEELMFRGVLQPLMTRLFQNVHFGILIAAVLFSAMHNDLAGFMPRFLLGAMFGYLVYWTGSLWTTIIAHCLHNTWQIALAYYLQDSDVSFEFNWIWVVASVVLTSGLMWGLYRERKL